MEFGFEIKSAHDHLKAIEKKGYIKTYYKESRAITITNKQLKFH